MPSILKHIPNPKVLFRPIQVKQDKVNKAFTNNYFLLSQSLSSSQNSLYKYIIAKVDTIGYIKINYELIDNYRKVLKFTLHSSMYSKNSRCNVSRRKIVEDIIFLIEVGAIVRIIKNSGHFILNPCYVFTKANTSRESIPLKYASEWMNNVTSGLFKEDFGMRYYIELATNKINATPLGSYTESGKIKHKKGDKLYQTICKLC